MFDRNQFFIKEHVAVFKLSDTFDILDPQTEQPLGVVMEEPSSLVRALRLILNKQFMNTQWSFYSGSSQQPGQRLFSMSKPASFLRNKVTIYDGQGQTVAHFESAVFALFQAFKILGADGQPIGEVKKDLVGWTFTIVDTNGNAFATITKKFAGVMKTLFTSADNYMVTLNGPPNPQLVMIALGMGVVCDAIFHEKK